MPTFRLTKESAIKLYWRVVGHGNNKINIYCTPCKVGHVIIVTDYDNIPVDKVLVRYDTKIFRNSKCIYAGTLNQDKE
jgi:hypothetical protein